jgi:hypothetical protein
VRNRIAVGKNKRAQVVSLCFIIGTHASGVLRSALSARPGHPHAHRSWLCHSDARQVCDLPSLNLIFLLGSPTRSSAVIDRKVFSQRFRQVTDLPRIGVAEPVKAAPDFFHEISSDAAAERWKIYSPRREPWVKGGLRS